ncbi:hypothetical protein [Streptomyces sp. NPDC001774]
MDDSMIGNKIGRNRQTVYKLRTGINTGMRRSTYEAIMGRLRPDVIASRPHPVRTKIPEGALRDAAGTRRRLQALRVKGFGNIPLAAMLNVAPEAISDMVRSTRQSVYHSTWAEVVDVYDKLADVDPIEYGLTETAVKRAITEARHRGWAPPECWDDDTIDTPDAFPEWTGACGSVTGYYLHLKHHIHLHITVDKHGRERRSVLCDACLDARTEAKQQPATVIDQDRIMQLLGEGLTPRQIADTMCISERTVQRAKLGRR